MNRRDARAIHINLRAMSAVPRVTNNAAAGQFEVQTEHGVARLRYVWRGDVLDLTHTSVPQEAEGRGIATLLARSALEYARAQGLKVIASCPFVHAYLRKHPEYADLIVSS
jgi:predicted GNAT family acetyltransferase